MAVLDEIIKPDPFNDIRDTLNAGGGSVNNEGVTAFLPSANINIFSFYKPHHRPQSFSPSAPYMPDARGGLYLDEIEHVIKWDAPRGGEASPYRWQDFIGYKYKSQPPSIDGTKLLATADITENDFDVTIEPTWGDSKFDWGAVCGGLTWDEMQVKVEVYNQRKTLMDSRNFKVKDINAIGRETLTLFQNNNINRGDDKLYLKGYFCDYNGNVLCPIPTTSDGFVEKPLMVTQSVYLYAGQVTVNNSNFTVRIRMEEGEGAWTSNVLVDITNNTSTDYNATTGYPQARFRFRAYDGSYTQPWQGGGVIEECRSIPKYITRTGRIQPGKWPSYGSVTKWYVDIEIKMN